MGDILIFFEGICNILCFNNLVILVSENFLLDPVNSSHLRDSFAVGSIGADKKSLFVVFWDRRTDNGLNTESTGTLHDDALVLSLLDLADIENTLSDIFDNLNEFRVSAPVVKISSLSDSLSSI